MKGKGIRIAWLIAAVMLVAGPTSAQQVYTMFGRLISNRGEFIKIPVIGEAKGNCNHFRQGWKRDTGVGQITFKGTGMLLKTGVMIPPRSTPNNAGKGTAAPFGCVDGSGMVTATAKGVGKRFTIPPPAGTTTQKGVPGAFFNKPLPGKTVAVYIPNEERFPQLATSFRIDAPQWKIPTVVQTWTDMGMAFMFDDRAMGFFRKPKATIMSPGLPANLAPHRVFHKSAWKGGPAMTFNGQTGRAAANFTWCFNKTISGDGRCDTIADGVGTGIQGHMLLKYRGGANRFGGTMSYVISTGPGKSNLALAPYPNQYTPIMMTWMKTLVLLRLGGMGHQATGRGYADRLTDAVKTGPIWARYKTMSVPVPQLGVSQMLVTTVMTNLKGTPTGTMTALVNDNIGFPFTTGTVLVRATGSTAALGGPATSTNTAMGSDRTIHSGQGRIITLVAGQMARTTEGSNTPGMVFLPEPDHSFQLLAGALALVGVALWRARRRH